MIKIYYYDGHHIDSGQTLEEIEAELAILIAEDEKLTEWPPID